MDITPEQVNEFRKTYNCLIKESHHQYSKPVIRPIAYGPDEAYTDLQVQVEAGIDVTLMREAFHQMLQDAEEGRVMRQLRNHHPALVEAWDNYRILAELTKRSHGL
jgi:hypothetical protein